MERDRYFSIPVAGCYFLCCEWYSVLSSRLVIDIARAIPQLLLGVLLARVACVSWPPILSCPYFGSCWTSLKRFFLRVQKLRDLVGMDVMCCEARACDKRKVLHWHRGKRRCFTARAFVVKTGGRAVRFVSTDRHASARGRRRVRDVAY